jgi:hypothetical protein
MDIGDTVIYGGGRFVVRGIDPAGVDPRFVYLEDATTGKAFSVTFEEPSRVTRSDATLHVVADEDRT